MNRSCDTQHLEDNPMKSKKGTWKRQSLSLALASVIALGTMLSFGAPIHAQASSDKQVGQLEQARTSSQTREDWKNWLSDNAVSLNSINPEQTGSDARIAPEKFADLEALKPLLQDKRIVYLGESSHGAAQYNSAKTRLIQYLHQELGFNVIAFETNLGQCSRSLWQCKLAKADCDNERFHIPHLASTRDRATVSIHSRYEAYR